MKRFSARIFYRPRVWLIIACLVILGWIIFSRYGILTRYHLEQINAQLDRQIQEQHRLNDSLWQYRRTLEHDTMLIEKLAREHYGMIRPGETVLIIVDSLHSR